MKLHHAALVVFNIGHPVYVAATPLYFSPGLSKKAYLCGR
jgi:hypothetical protein